MDLAPLQAAAESSGWDFRFLIEWGNPIFYLNAACLAAAVTMVYKLRDLRGIDPLAGAAWRTGWVFVAGTGLHFLGDLFNFPEGWDHILIHAVLLAALLTFVVSASDKE